MSSSVAAPVQSDVVVEQAARSRGGHAAFLLALGLAELAWLAVLAYGLLALVN